MERTKCTLSHLSREVGGWQHCVSLSELARPCCLCHTRKLLRGQSPMLKPSRHGWVCPLKDAKEPISFRQI